MHLNLDKKIKEFIYIKIYFKLIIDNILNLNFY